MVLTNNIESLFSTDSFHLSNSSREEVCNQVIHEGMSSLDAGKINLPYRMEYRKGYPLAKHLGEERFLLFRSDRPGAIAKIVFSSEDCTEDDEADQAKDTQNPINMIAIAKIHVLEVKKEHRGNDFGGLLFHQATISLLHRYDFVDCHLDAEEDSRRHDRLILFYKQLGFQVKPRAKIKYINNNDGEIYRKVPMCINLKRLTSKKSLVGVRFLPIRFLLATGESTKIAAMVVPGLGRNITWLMMDDGSGKIIFQTTVGYYLRIEDTGFCAVSDLYDDFCQFHVFTVSQFNSENGSDPTQVQGKNLLLFQSSQGFFLSLHENYLSGSRCPSFWDLDEGSCTLTCSNDFPSLPLHQAFLKRPQLIGEHVEPQFWNISLKSLTIKEGLYWLKEIPFRPLHIGEKTISLRTFCYQAGEAARASGHPDWFQLVAIIHELGHIVSLIEPSLICRKSIPEDVEVKSTCLLDNTDSLAQLAHPIYSQKGNTIDASCIDYLYHMLKHNDVLIPDEGLSILRYYASLKSHIFHKGGAPVRQNSDNLQELVNDFDLIRQIASQNCQDELSNEQCNNLWESHYNHLIKKYGMSKAPQWEIEFHTNESSIIQDNFGHSTLNFKL